MAHRYSGKVPKAAYKGGPKKQFRTQAKLVAGRAATGIQKDARSRYKTLADLGATAPPAPSR
jgi:hypothetical protein